MGILYRLREKKSEPWTIDSKVYYPKIEINYISLKWQNKILTQDALKWEFNSCEISINFNFRSIKNQTIKVSSFDIMPWLDPNLP